MVVTTAHSQQLFHCLHELGDQHCLFFGRLKVWNNAGKVNLLCEQPAPRLQGLQDRLEGASRFFEVMEEPTHVREFELVLWKCISEDVVAQNHEVLGLESLQIARFEVSCRY